MMMQTVSLFLKTIIAPLIFAVLFFFLEFYFPTFRILIPALVLAASFAVSAYWGGFRINIGHFIFYYGLVFAFSYINYYHGSGSGNDPVGRDLVKYTDYLKNITTFISIVIILIFRHIKKVRSNEQVSILRHWIFNLSFAAALMILSFYLMDTYMFETLN
jgi:hypothetical protein